MNNIEQKTFQDECLFLELTVEENSFDFMSSISSAMKKAEEELLALNESANSISNLRPSCDKVDYTLAACSGALCGIIDIFLVGKPGDSFLGKQTDNWAAEKTIDFAKHCGWKPRKECSASNAIAYLERKFKVPYDQRGAGDAGSIVFELSPENHHFKSLAHNPSLLGLFFSILNQWNDSSHFVTVGELISLEKADDSFQLKGHDVPSKIFCGLVNWLGHLVSDFAGASGSSGRGMGIPSPLWTWTNDIIAIKRALHIEAWKFDKTVNDLALQIYLEGFDLRFQIGQTIPVVINELLVRTLYSIRRLVQCFSKKGTEELSFSTIWKMCEPFSNPTVKRMLTVAHGVFVLVDAGDATVRSFIKGGGRIAPTEFFLRLNIVGVGRFAVSLYGEGKRAYQLWQIEQEAGFDSRESVIVKDYITGLKLLAVQYDDRYLLNFVDDFQHSHLYESAFLKSVELAELRRVPDDRILRNKQEIDSYFRGRSSNG